MQRTDGSVRTRLICLIKRHFEDKKNASRLEKHYANLTDDDKSKIEAAKEQRGPSLAYPLFAFVPLVN